MQGARGLPKPRRFGSGFGCVKRHSALMMNVNVYLEAYGLVRKGSRKENLGLEPGGYNNITP